MGSGKIEQIVYQGYSQIKDMRAASDGAAVFVTIKWETGFIDRFIEAVRAYHAVLERLSVTPRRSLADDLVLETGVMSCSGSETTTLSLPPARTASTEAAAVDDSPDFSAMTSEERLAYHRRRLANLLGP